MQFLVDGECDALLGTVQVILTSARQELNKKTYHFATTRCTHVIPSTQLVLSSPDPEALS